MELPHLKLFWRRLTASPPPDAGVLQWLRSPLLRHLLTWALWLCVALAGMVNFDALAPGISRFPAWLVDLGTALQILATTVGKLWVYFLFANSANDVAADAGHAVWPRLPTPAPPAWFATPLPSFSALVSAFLRALVLAAPVLLGMLVYLALQHQLDLADGTLDSFDQLAFWWGNITSIFKLPAYFLACCCISLALRQTPLWSLCPPVLAACATFSWGLAGSGVAAGFNGTLAMSMPFGPGADPRAHLILTAVCALLAALVLACRWLATREDLSWIKAMLLVTLCGWPALCTVLQESSDVHYAPLTFLSCTLHAFYATFLPDIQLVNLSSSYFAPSPDMPANVYGLWLYLDDAGILTAISCLLNTAFWGWAAYACLNAARGIRQTADGQPADRAA